MLLLIERFKNKNRFKNKKRQTALSFPFFKRKERRRRRFFFFSEERARTKKKKTALSTFRFFTSVLKLPPGGPSAPYLSSLQNQTCPPPTRTSSTRGSASPTRTATTSSAAPTRSRSSRGRASRRRHCSRYECIAMGALVRERSILPCFFAPFSTRLIL